MQTNAQGHIADAISRRIYGQRAEAGSDKSMHVYDENNAPV